MSELTERLQSHMGKADMGDVLRDCREAAARIEALETALRLAWSLADPEMVTASHKRIIRAALAPEQDK
jgi:hypothetical protein